MARLGVNYETIKQTAVKLLSQGIAPSVQKIREVLGTGSNTTIAEHLKVWRDEYAQKAIHHLPANMPKELISAFEVLWQAAMAQAQHQLAEYKQAIENDCATALQREQDAEKAAADLKQKIAEISTILEQGIAAKQQLNIELALTNERLIKQDEAIAAQKNQYEDRLKRVYEEKDMLLTQCHQLQSDVMSLQEKISLQTEQHQDSIAQHNVLHQQSESRWVKLIDQAKQEANDMYKRCEIISKNSDEKIKKLSAALTDLQQNTFEKNSQLNASQQWITQLKQEVKFLETEYIKARAVILKLEEEQKSVRTVDKNKLNNRKHIKPKIDISS